MRKLKNSELERKTEEQYKITPKIPITVVLDNVRSLNNIGSVFRTSDAFFIEQIFLCGISGTPPHNDIRKTAIGAEKTVNWQYFQDTRTAVYELKKNNYSIISIEQTQNSIPLNEFKIDITKKHCLIFGNEVKGVQQFVVDVSDFCIEIPQSGTKHSLNVSVCAGIVIWEFYKEFFLR